MKGAAVHRVRARRCAYRRTRPPREHNTRNVSALNIANKKKKKKEGADSEQTLRNSSDGEAAKQTDTERSDEYTRR